MGGVASELDLSCTPNDLVSVALSGACAVTTDASDPRTYDYGGAAVYVRTYAPGVCTVKLTFASGFVFSTDIDFEPQPWAGSACGGCPSIVAPKQSRYVVANPATTCVDAGSDT